MKVLYIRTQVDKGPNAFQLVGEFATWAACNARCSALVGGLDSNQSLSVYDKSGNLLRFGFHKR